MKNIKISLFIGILFVGALLAKDKCLPIDATTIKNNQEHMNEKKLKHAAEAHVIKQVLSNGLTVLVRVVDTLPKVSIQIWYDVGSKDEKTGEKGIAHLIEHMVFKGTKNLSESDINILAHRLSGSINAFTSWDYTGYLFNMPKQHWQEVFPVMADSMQNVSFKDDHLNSEMKAVIQELKMYRDNFQRTLIEDMVSAVFADHPYHYPIIGYKQDLWELHGEDLRKFYKKHYCPNNATLVIVGDVDAQEVFKQAEKYFGSIAPCADYKKEEFYFNTDIVAKSVKLYRDVQQPLALVAWVIPGAREKIDPLIDVVSSVLSLGRGSRLYQKLVNELQLVTSITSFGYTLFDHGLFFIMYEPKNVEDVSKIESIINQEIASIAKNGIKDKELIRAVKNSQMNYYGLLEDVQQQAYAIGQGYLATGDENFAFEYLTEPTKELAQDVRDLITTYFRPSVMNTGIILPLPESEKKTWERMQKESDELDKKILFARERSTPVEEPKYALTVKVKESTEFKAPRAQHMALSNGLKVLYYNNDNTPKINITIELLAKDYFDPEGMEGLYSFMTAALTEGTEKYNSAQLADELESRGMSLSITPGYISMTMLSDDFEKGLELLQEILLHPRFEEKEIEKVRSHILADIKNFWDEPKSFSGQLVREKIYAGHPYAKNRLGTKEVIDKITKKDLIDIYKKLISPSGAKVAVVGDIDHYDLKAILEKYLGSWKGAQVQEMKMPFLAPIEQETVVYPINRDQVVLVFAGLSVDRKNPDYDKLLLFDQIFGGGALGSLHSRLFSLREQSGLFYTINGSLTAGADLQPGMVMIKTIVSLDRLAEAQKVIKETIAQTVDTITQVELNEARNAVETALVKNFATNQGIAGIFLTLDKYGFPADYIDTRAQELAKISLDQVKTAVKKVLDNDKMITFKIGREEEVPLLEVPQEDKE